ncbi:MAG: phospholipid carrier-dependent glycosyltransferase, partial [Candidatus Buchananbacteria bacterium]|nr:phospholipid carrier-dependent glycosyltransferase [Candidatus Buchananbacteria bacterium]
HPPLGKLMIAGFAKIFNFRPEFSFAQIGDKFPDNKYLALRFLPSLAGALLPIVVFLLALQLKFRPQTAFFGGLLVALDNALLVQTHYILMDGFLLLFGFLTLLFYFRRKFLWMAIFGGLAISIKWTGLTFLALSFLIEIFYLFKEKNLKSMLKLPVYFLLIPLALYFSVFAVHFSLLTKPGTGDAFMSSNFHNENVFKKFTELNIQMYQSNQRLTATHPYGSSWYSWPFMTRPIFYWVSGDSRIYLLGNPIIWWASTVAIILLLLRNFQFSISNFQLKASHILLGGYLLNLLPFIGIKRVMFLYHYLTGLIFAILILAYLIEKQDGSTWFNSKKIFIGLTIASAVAFIYFAPLTYGLPLSPKAYDARVWLSSWR